MGDRPARVYALRTRTDFRRIVFFIVHRPASRLSATRNLASVRKLVSSDHLRRSGDTRPSIVNGRFCGVRKISYTPRVSGRQIYRVDTGERPYYGVNESFRTRPTRKYGPHGVDRTYEFQLEAYRCCGKYQLFKVRPDLCTHI